jgi:drug/metabolite transporter (DMT)-like permease
MEPVPTVEAGVVLGLASAGLWGIANVFAALIGERLRAWWLLTAWLLIGLPIILVMARGATFESIDPVIAILTMIGGVLTTVAYGALIMALQRGPLVVVSPVLAANGGLGAILAVVFLHEPLSAGQAIGAALATLGVVLVSVRFEADMRQTRLVSAGVLFALIATAAFALQTTVLTPPTREIGWEPILLITRATTFVVLLGILGSIVIRERRHPTGALPSRAALTPRTIVYIVIGGIASTSAFVLFAVGLSRSYAWVFGVTTAFSPIVVLVAGILIFGERLRAIQWAGALLVLASVVIVSLF